MAYIPLATLKFLRRRELGYERNGFAIRGR